VTPEDYEKFCEIVRNWGLIGTLRALARICDHWATNNMQDEPEASRRWRRAEGTLGELVKYLEDAWK
jgi:hypothetical protein